jgi:hypothetical protein
MKTFSEDELSSKRWYTGRKEQAVIKRNYEKKSIKMSKRETLDLRQ